MSDQEGLFFDMVSPCDPLEDMTPEELERLEKITFDSAFKFANVFIDLQNNIGKALENVEIPKDAPKGEVYFFDF